MLMFFYGHSSWHVYEYTPSENTLLFIPLPNDVSLPTSRCVCVQTGKTCAIVTQFDESWKIDYRHRFDWVLLLLC